MKLKMLFTIGLILLAISEVFQLVSADVNSSSYHLTFGTEYPEIKLIELKIGGLRIFYEQKGGTFHVTTSDYATYTTQKITEFGNNEMMMIFKDGGKYNLGSKSVVAVTKSSKIYTSADEGVTWKEYCQSNCIEIKESGNTVTTEFSHWISTSWNDKNKVFLTMVDNSNRFKIHSSKEIKKWYMGNQFSDSRINSYPYAILDVPLVSDPSSVSTILLSSNKSDFAFVQHPEISIKDDVPELKVDYKFDTKFDHFGDIFIISTATSDLEKSSAILSPILNNKYVTVGKGGVDFQYIVGVPRSLTLKREGSATHLLQRPLVNVEKWDTQTFPKVKLANDMNPLACFVSTSFLISFEFKETGNDDKVALQVRADESYSSFTEIGYSTEDGFYVDRRKSGGSEFMDGAKKSLYEVNIMTNRIAKSSSGEIKVTGLVDMNSIEVFGMEGEIAFSCVIFPKADQNYIKIIGKEGTEVKNFKFSKFKPNRN